MTDDRGWPDRTRLPVQPAEPADVAPAFDVRDQRPGFPRPRSVAAPAGAPNVLLVLVDDMGFGASSAFGGPCSMPAAERLAAGGLRYNRFHTTAVCSPTRAALLTGRNHHSVGMGNVTDFSTTAPGYTGIRPPQAGTLARVLRDNGYATGAFGKWHQTPHSEVTPVGPFDRWPTGEGFERFYGFLSAAEDQFSPTLFEGTTQIDPTALPREGYHLSEDLVERTMDWVGQVRTYDRARPWFGYLAFGATHWPSQVPDAWRDRYRGRFEHGWDRQRELTLERQKELGVVPPDAELAPWPEDVPRWDDLTADQRLVAERLMEAYAAFAEHTDAQVARLVRFLEERGELENTLLLYILGDNGASAEGGMEGSFNGTRAVNGIRERAQDMIARLDEIGGPTSNCNYPVGWALAMDTPFQWTKQVASHYGGTRNGMVVHWPAGIREPGGLRTHWHHVIDVLPTVLEAARLPEPESVDGIPQAPVEGTSFLYSLNDPAAEERHTTQYFELFGNRGVYHRGWTAVAKHRTPWGVSGWDRSSPAEDTWELYDTTADFSQAKDLSSEHPDRLAELQELFLREARRFQVLPLDDRGVERMDAEAAGRAVNDAGTSIVLTPRSWRLGKGAWPSLRNTSFTIEADFEATGSADGVLVAEGNVFNGMALYLKQGVPVFVHNYCGLEWTHIRGRAAVPEGRHRLVYRFGYDGGGVGRGGEGRLVLDGAEVGRGRIARTPAVASGYVSVGCNPGQPVTPDYSRAGTNPFTGTIHTVTITRGDDGVEPSPRQQLRAELAWH